MSDPTMIASIILAGVFSIIAITILKDGTSKAKEMWEVMSALTGVAFGAIISYYFTDQKYEAEIASVRESSQATISSLNQDIASLKNRAKSVESIAINLENSLRPVYTSFQSDTAPRWSLEYWEAAGLPDDPGRGEVASQLGRYLEGINEIKSLMDIGDTIAPPEHTPLPFEWPILENPTFPLSPQEAPSPSSPLPFKFQGNQYQQPSIYSPLESSQPLNEPTPTTD